jgi:hypothetical protein
MKFWIFLFFSLSFLKPLQADSEEHSESIADILSPIPERVRKKWLPLYLEALREARISRQQQANLLLQFAKYLRSASVEVDGVTPPKEFDTVRELETISKTLASLLVEIDPTHYEDSSIFLQNARPRAPQAIAQEAVELMIRADLLLAKTRGSSKTQMKWTTHLVEVSALASALMALVLYLKSHMLGASIAAASGVGLSALALYDLFRRPSTGAIVPGFIRRLEQQSYSSAAELRFITSLADHLRSAGPRTEFDAVTIFVPLKRHLSNAIQSLRCIEALESL